MKLPEWTILPVVIGFFILLVFDREFFMFIHGYRSTTDNQLDVTRLILNCFLLGIIPTLGTYNFLDYFKKKLWFRQWHASLTDTQRQLFFISFTLLFGLITTTFFNFTIGRDTGSKVVYKIARPYFDQPLEDSMQKMKENFRVVDRMASKIEVKSRSNPKFAELADRAQKITYEFAQLAYEFEDLVSRDDWGLEINTRRKERIMNDLDVQIHEFGKIADEYEVLTL